MRRFVCLMLAMMLVCGAFGTAAFAYVPDTYTGEGQGYGPIKVTVTVDEGVITEAVIEHNETEGIGKALIDALVDANALVGLTSADDFAGLDAVSSATCTMTVAGLKDALAAAFAAAEGEAAAMAFTAGTYNASAKGYNGMSEFAVTFSDAAIESIEVVSSTETEHVGDLAFEPMIADMIAANGSGVDAVS